MVDVPAGQNYPIFPFSSVGMVLIGLNGCVNDCHFDVITQQDMIECCAAISGCTFKMTIFSLFSFYPMYWSLKGPFLTFHFTLALVKTDVLPFLLAQTELRLLSRPTAPSDHHFATLHIQGVSRL